MRTENTKSWIRIFPGLDDLQRGRKLRGTLVFLLFFGLTSLAIWRAPRIIETLGQTAGRARGEVSLLDAASLDQVLSSLLLLLCWFAVLGWTFWGSRTTRGSALRSADASEGPWRSAWRGFATHRLALAGSVVVLIIHFVALFCPLLAPFDPSESGHIVDDKLLAPSLEHLLGTDRMARDVFSRVLYGSRVSLLIGFFSMTIAVLIGTSFGAIAGYCGGRIDSLMMRCVDTFLAFPTVILLITVVSLWSSKTIWLICIVIGLMSWMGLARLVRAQCLSLKEREHYEAARALGAGAFRLITRHLLPNAITPIIIFATLRVGNVILLEAGLSYLGLGVPALETATWGNIIYDNRGSILEEWWIPLSAGLAIVVTVIGYNLIGDGLRDALDSRGSSSIKNSM